MPDLLLEIGSEEIPARALLAVLPELERLAKERLTKAELGMGELRSYGTPRRVALAVSGLDARQRDVDEELVGPPVSAGAKAAEGFAKKHGLAPEAIVERETEKGRRFAARRRIEGRATHKVLPELLHALILELPWPKSMRWGAHRETFVRPIRWIVALFDGEVVPLEIAGVRSGRASRGHRFLAPAPFEVASAAAWREELRRRFVIACPIERRQLVGAELKRLEGESGLRVRPDEPLLDEVTSLVEYPVGISGSFDERHLEIPEEVIVSAMRGHQRYFAMTTPAGRLANRFATIAATIVKDPAVVVHGNERVLAARLHDARFFFEEDLKTPLEARVDKLGGIVWVKGLGTMREKVERFAALAADLAREVGVDEKQARRAALLAKADLATHLVGEFPDLQGHIGTAYARRAGEAPEVAAAIAEHYQPRGAQDAPAPSPVGAVLAIADRIDSLLGCFAVGLEPTGSADPFGMRRAALGVLATLLEHGWTLSLEHLARAAAKRFEKVDAASAVPKVLEFLRVRLRNLLAEGFPADVVDAVLAAAPDNPVDARARVRALAVLRPRADFEPLGVAIKRVGNILKGTTETGPLDATLLREPAERALAEVADSLARRVAPLLERRAYDEALAALSELKTPVDHFFDQVFVMDPDARIRGNRLALLSSIHRLFFHIADFRQLNVG